MTDMFTMEVTTKTREVIIELGRQIEIHERHMFQALHDIGNEVKREIIKLIRRPPKTGRIYTYRGAKHQASAPGESPANRSGRLVKSASYRTYSHEKMEVGMAVDYALYLEMGTRKMKPRPYLIRAVMAKHRDAVLILESALKGHR